MTVRPDTHDSRLAPHTYNGGRGDKVSTTVRPVLTVSWTSEWGSEVQHRPTTGAEGNSHLPHDELNAIKRSPTQRPRDRPPFNRTTPPTAPNPSHTPPTPTKDPFPSAPTYQASPRPLPPVPPPSACFPPTRAECRGGCGSGCCIAPRTSSTPGTWPPPSAPAWLTCPTAHTWNTHQRREETPDRHSPAAPGGLPLDGPRGELDKQMSTSVDLVEYSTTMRLLI
jgi:hypothetical protein